MLKFRERSQEYHVYKHGNGYIDLYDPIPICPDCQSTNVRKVEDGEVDIDSDYVCLDCSCEFDIFQSNDLTVVGKTVSLILKFFIVIFIVIGIVCFFGGLLYAHYLDTVYPNDTYTSEQMSMALLITFGCPVVCLLLMLLFLTLERNI